MSTSMSFPNAFKQHSHQAVPPSVDFITEHFGTGRSLQGCVSLLIIPSPGSLTAPAM